MNLPEKSRGRWGLGITFAVMKRCHWVEPVEMNAFEDSFSRPYEKQAEHDAYGGVNVRSQMPRVRLEGYRVRFVSDLKKKG